MKLPLCLCLFLILISSCKDEKKVNSSYDPSLEAVETDSTYTNIDTSDASNKISKKLTADKPREVPSQFRAVFVAHSGLSRWKQMKNLCFEMNGENGEETHTISLPDQKTRIESKDWSIGYDGKKVWLLKHDIGYEGDPIFYHDLMFNFFAMPFILADAAVTYEALEPASLDGKIYNAYKVSYSDGVGDSSKDEYKVFFDPATHKISWLAYTITPENEMKSEQWRYVKYDKWQDINGLLFPKKLTWYSVENGKPKGKEMDVKFDKITATETILDPSVFKKPAEGQFVN